nr:helix-turn-helix transcriptional regulator [Endozoicomonas sp.]
MQTLGQRLKESMALCGYTPAKLEKESGVSRQYIYNLLNDAEKELNAFHAANPGINEDRDNRPEIPSRYQFREIGESEWEMSGKTVVMSSLCSVTIGLSLRLELWIPRLRLLTEERPLVYEGFSVDQIIFWSTCLLSLVHPIVNQGSLTQINSFASVST